MSVADCKSSGELVTASHAADHGNAKSELSLEATPLLSKAGRAKLSQTNDV